MFWTLLYHSQIYGIAYEAMIMYGRVACISIINMIWHGIQYIAYNIDMVCVFFFAAVIFSVPMDLHLHLFFKDVFSVEQ